MTERSLFWDGIATGDCGPYGSSQYTDVFLRAWLNGTGNQGVLRGWLNELAVTNGGGLNAAVDTGGAIVYGLFYDNDAATTVVLPDNSTVLVIVRRSWAAQTARLTHDNGAGLVHTAGVTYDIPLAEVTTLAGIITVITDLRDYCEFSMSMPSLSVQTTHIQNDAVVPGKMVNHPRWLSRGAGTLKQDSANPATWVANGAPNIYRDSWEFNNAALNAVWLTFRVPEDYASANITPYLWLSSYLSAAAANEYWGFSAWVGAPGAVLANQVGAMTVAEDGATWDWYRAKRFSLPFINVTAGDLVHCQIYRNGGHANDTSTSESYLFMVQLLYMADG
jgi:hypothetical protein